MKYADLHIHTKFSDGTLDAGQIVQEAKSSKVSCISITDHDSVEAYNSLGQLDIEIIPGIELSSNIGDVEVHILGYFIDYKEEWFREKLIALRQVRVERIFQMCEKLNELGIVIKPEEILNSAGPSSSVGRLHLAKLMAEKGLVSNYREAFYKYIGEGRPAYVSKFKLTPYEAISLILKVKGIPVLAHPYSLTNQKIIPELIRAGLMGIEAIYPEHTPKQRDYYIKLAQENELFVTGGSDYHGYVKPEVKIGTVNIPYSLVEELKNAKLKLNECKT